MKLKLWGTRGSLPRAITNEEIFSQLSKLFEEAIKGGISDIKQFRTFMHKKFATTPFLHGGNSICSQVIAENQKFFIDMGSGIRQAGTEAIAQGITKHIVFQTHMHWDHVIGLPFFVPIYTPGHHLTIYHVHKNAPEYIKILFNGVNFPVKWEEISSQIEFKQVKLYEKLTFDDLTVTPFALDHPGGSFGYRFEKDNQSIVIGIDGEYKRVNSKDLGKDLPYYQNLDLILFDAQYEMEEYTSKFDYGHCTPTIGADLALREGIKNIILAHHDPWSTDDKLNDMAEVTREYIKKHLPTHQSIWNKRGQPLGPNVITAYDGLEIDLDEI